METTTTVEEGSWPINRLTRRLDLPWNEHGWPMNEG